MKHIKTYTLFERVSKETNVFESRFQEFRKLISDLKDLSLEFEDNNCQCKIFPDQLNILSPKSRGHLGGINQPFYLEIDVFKLVSRNQNSWFDSETGQNVQMFSLSDWFIENCREIESYMQSEGFTTKPSIRYALDWENLETIDELAEQQSLIYKVRLEFLPV